MLIVVGSRRDRERVAAGRSTGRSIVV